MSEVNERPDSHAALPQYDSFGLDSGCQMPLEPSWSGLDVRIQKKEAEGSHAGHMTELWFQLHTEGGNHV